MAAPIPAGAQDQGSAGASAIGDAMSVAEIRHCTCEKGEIDAGRAELETQRALLADRQAELANLEAEVIRQRQAMNPSDTVAQQILKNLIGQQTALRNLLQSTLEPEFGRRVDALARGVGVYNLACATKVRFEADVKAALKDLQCQAP